MSDTKTQIQTIVEELARKAALAVPPDVMMHPMPLPTRLDYAEKQIRQIISPILTAALEVAELILRISKQKVSKPDYWSSCGQCKHNTNDASEALSSLNSELKAANLPEIV